MSHSNNSQDISSLLSLDSENTGNEHVPVQLDTSNTKPRRQTLLRRLSSVRSTLSFDNGNGLLQSVLKLNSNQRSVSAGMEEYYNIHHDDLDSGYLFGENELSMSFTRAADEEQGVINEEGEDDMVEAFPKYYPGSRRASKTQLRRPSTYTEEEINRSPTRRDTVTSTIQVITKKLGFWDEEFHVLRISIILTFAKNYLYLIVGFIIALSIYWGSYYERSTRYPNLNFAVINADQKQGDLPAILGPTIEYFFVNVTAVQLLGTFHIMDYKTINEAASNHNISISQEVRRLVHHHKYWAAYYIKENATLNMYEQLKSASNSSSPADSLMEVIYETGQDYNAVANYISVLVQSTMRAYYLYMPQTSYIENLLSTLTSSEINNVITKAPSLLTIIPNFKVIDLLPATNPVIGAPFQIGIIYLVMFSFFQFIFSIKIHMFVAKKITGFKYIFYRIAASHASYVVIALAYVTLNTAFGISYSNAFGRLGFLVVWGFAILTISSLGSLIEALALIAIAVKPQLIGFVLLFVAVINMSVVVSPMALCPSFYRYGYAMPVRNSYELLNVAYFDAYKGNMGRNIGILIAWIVVSTLVIIFVMTLLGKKQKKMEAKKLEEEKIKNDTKTVENT